MAAIALMALPTAATAQGEEPAANQKLTTGFYRIVHNGYGDVLNVDKKYGFSLDATENDARTMPGSIFYYDTDGMYMLGDDMEQLDATNPNYVNELQDLMARAAWKSGSYSTYDITSQGISFVGGYLANLEKYVNAAFDNFHESEEVAAWYENTENINARVYLMIAMPKYFNPMGLTSLEGFKNAVHNFMATWKSYLDLGIYLQPAPEVENGYLLTFHSPVDNVNGIRIAKTMEELSHYNLDDAIYDFSFDFFGAVKRQVVAEAAKELDGEALAYVERILEPIELDKMYYICENESGELYVAGFNFLNGTFGEEGAFDGINQEETVWIMQPVDDDNPLTVGMDRRLKDVDGRYYATMFTEFAYQPKEGVEAYYVDDVVDGVAHLVKIEGKVPAATAVILCSKSADDLDNALIPTDEDVPALEGNLLKGTCLPMAATESVSTLRLATDGETANIVMGKADEVEANQCYIDTPENGSDIIIAAAANGATDPSAIRSAWLSNSYDPSTVYDLQGRQVDRPAKGLYITDGHKVVVK